VVPEVNMSTQISFAVLTGRGSSDSGANMASSLGPIGMIDESDPGWEEAESVWTYPRLKANRLSSRAPTPLGTNSTRSGVATMNFASEILMQCLSVSSDLRLERFCSRKFSALLFTSKGAVQERRYGTQLAEGVDCERHLRGIGAEDAHHMARLHAMQA
jgi:hypothetical protein